MLSCLFFPYHNKSVRLQGLLGFNNTVVGKMLYLYNPYIYDLLYNNKKVITSDIKVENTEPSVIPNKKLNAYQLFIKENYTRIKSENPFLTSKEIITELGKEWSENKKKSL